MTQQSHHEHRDTMLQYTSVTHGSVYRSSTRACTRPMRTLRGCSTGSSASTSRSTARAVPFVLPVLLVGFVVLVASAWGGGGAAPSHCSCACSRCMGLVVRNHLHACTDGWMYEPWPQSAMPTLDACMQYSHSWGIQWDCSTQAPCMHACMLAHAVGVMSDTAWTAC